MVGYAVRLLEVYLIDYFALAGVKLSHVHFYLGSIDDFFMCTEWIKLLCACRILVRSFLSGSDVKNAQNVVGDL